jgi:hypothetical protein
MKRAIFSAVAAAVALMAVIAYPAFGDQDRLTDQTSYIKQLNGSPTKIGVLTITDGGTVTNWNTPVADGGLATGGGAFDAGTGNLLMIQCLEAVQIATGTTVDAHAVHLNTVKEKFYMTLKRNQNTIAIRTADDSDCIPCCSVFNME